MFEVTIRTDDQTALQKLLELMTTLDFKVFKEPASNGVKPSHQLDAEVFWKVAPSANTEAMHLEEEFRQDEISRSKVEPLSGKGWVKGQPIPLPPGFDEPLENYPAGFGGAKGMFVMSPDFDEPLEDFNEYM